MKSCGIGIGTSFVRRRAFRPTYLSSGGGPLLWLRSDLGVTTVDAAYNSPNDISTGSWSASNVTGRTATRMYDNNVNAAHQLLQDPANLQLDHSAHYRIDIPLVGTAEPLGRYVHVYVNSGAAGVFVDTSGVGTVMSSTGVTNVTYIGGVLEFDVANTAFLSTMFRTSNDGVSDVYLGDGTRFCQIGPGTDGHAAVEVTQRNASAWADQTGLGNNALQGSATARPLWRPNRLAGKPSLSFLSGAQFDFLTHPISLAGNDSTVYLVARAISFPGLDYGDLISFDTNGPYVYSHQSGAGTQPWGAYFGGPQSASYNLTAEKRLIVATRNFNDVDLYTNGTKETKVGGTAFYTAAGRGIGGTTSQPSTAEIFELAVWDRVLTAEEISTLDSYSAAFWSIPGGP